jgi:hypothetical protein
MSLRHLKNPSDPKITNRCRKCTKGNVEVRNTVEGVVAPRNGSQDSNIKMPSSRYLSRLPPPTALAALLECRSHFHCHDTTAVDRDTHCACAATVVLSLSPIIHSGALVYLLYPFHHGTQAQALEQCRRESLIDCCGCRRCTRKVTPPTDYDGFHYESSRR